MIREHEVNNRYFQWIYNIVCGYDNYNHLSYKKLLLFLYETEFTYIIPLDENRAKDGTDFRYRFGYEFNYPKDIIINHLDTRPCSVLEMMVALAFKVEEQIMDDYEYGNRTGQWFWNMIVNLGLGNMSDKNFNEIIVYNIVSRFLDREYDYDGKGGLFTIPNCRHDLRHVEIWTQFMWYLDSVI